MKATRHMLNYLGTDRQRGKAICPEQRDVCPFYKNAKKTRRRFSKHLWSKFFGSLVSIPVGKVLEVTVVNFLDVSRCRKIPCPVLSHYPCVPMATSSAELNLLQRKVLLLASRLGAGRVMPGQRLT